MKGDKLMSSIIYVVLGRWGIGLEGFGKEKEGRD